MRTINLIPDIVKDTDSSKFPDSTIVNETDTQPGTPVIREIYGDLLTNFYKILRMAGITANGIEDNELNGYQILAALQKLPNILNDVEQQLSLSGSVFSVGIDISSLPNKYFLFVRTAEASPPSGTFTFKGSLASPVYNFTPMMPFNSGDELLLIIDTATVRAYNLSDPDSQSADVFAPFGTPLAFNDGSKVYYQSEGVIFSDLPELYDLQAAIRTTAGDGTLVVYEMLLLQGYVLCLVFAPGTQTYTFWRFAISNLTAPLTVSVTGASLPTGVDHRPFIYTDGNVLFITNGSGNNANDYNLNSFNVNMSAGTLVFTGSINIDTGFEKTTNAVIVGNKLYTFIGGALKQYNLAGGAVAFINSFPGYLGVIFGLNGKVYYSSGDAAKKWTLAS